MPAGNRPKDWSENADTGAAEQTVEVVLNDRGLLASLLEEKAGDGGLDQPVLIPFGMTGDETGHGIEQILRELVFHTHVGASVSGMFAMPSSRFCPSITPQHPLGVKERYRCASHCEQHETSCGAGALSVAIHACVGAPPQLDRCQCSAAFPPGALRPQGGRRVSR